MKLSASSAVSLDAGDFDIGYDMPVDEENVTRRTADRALRFQIDESSIERGGDGTFTFEVEDE